MRSLPKKTGARRRLSVPTALRLQGLDDLQTEDRNNDSCKGTTWAGRSLDESTLPGERAARGAAVKPTRSEAQHARHLNSRRIESRCRRTQNFRQPCI